MTILENQFLYAFEAGWRKFVKGIHKENDRKNARMFRLLAAIKGQAFVDDLRAYMKCINCEHAVLRVVKEPLGSQVSNRRFESMRVVWIDRQPSGDGRMTGTVCIQVKANRWLKIRF